MPFVLLLLQSSSTRVEKSLRKEIESEIEKKKKKINTFDNCRDTWKILLMISCFEFSFKPKREFFFQRFIHNFWTFHQETSWLFMNCLIFWCFNCVHAVRVQNYILAAKIKHEKGGKKSFVASHKSHIMSKAVCLKTFFVS